MPHIYKAVVYAVSRTTNCDHKRAAQAISETLKTLHTRRNSVEFVKMHPSESLKVAGYANLQRTGAQEDHPEEHGGTNPSEPDYLSDDTTVIGETDYESDC